MVNIVALDEATEKTEAHRPWVDRLWKGLDDGHAAAYSNFLGDEGEARIREAYPVRTWERLARIKAIYDPTNVFRLNQNIAPVRAS